MSNNNGRRAAFIEVSYENLKQALQLPEDTIITSVEQDGHDRLYGRFVVFVHHPALPLICEGCEVRGYTVDEIRDLTGVKDE